MGNRAYDQILPSVSDAQQGSTPDTRTTRYGDTYAYDSLNLDALAEDGELFVTTNAVQGTGVTVGPAITQAAAVLLPMLFGSVPTTTKKFVRLHRLKIRLTGIGSGHTSINFNVVTSVGAVRSSAGTDYLALHSALGVAGYHGIRSDQNPASVMSALWAGVPVTTLGTTPKLITHWNPRTGTIPVALDEYTITFGGPGIFHVPADHAVVASTTVNMYYHQSAPCIVGPGSSFAVGLWAASMAGTTAAEWELIWSER